jgi:IS30 family transposase
MVCATTIYGFIQQGKASGGDLHKHLRHRKPYMRITNHEDHRIPLMQIAQYYSSRSPNPIDEDQVSSKQY